MSIANDSKSNQLQLEFQQLGEASTSTMLIQPLLEHASTYNCHLVNMMTTLRESAVPRDAVLIKIKRNPLLRALDDSDLSDHVNLAESGLEGKYAAFQTEFDSTSIRLPHITEDTVANIGMAAEQSDLNELLVAYDSGEIFREGVTSPSIDVREFTIKTPEHASSSSDFLWKLQEEITQKSAMLYKLIAEDDAGYDARHWSDDENEMIQLKIDLSGKVKLRVSRAVFRCGFMFVFSPLWQQLMGSPHEILLAETLFTNTSSVGADFKFEKVIYRTKLDELSRTGEFDDDVALNAIWSALLLVDKDRHVTLPLTNNVFELCDCRKQLLLDVTIPLDATLRWDSGNTDVRHQLQEFELNPGKIETETSMDYSYITQDQLIGARALIDNDANLAVKKLFEGQMQAIRVQQRIRQLEMDTKTGELEEKVVDMEYLPGDFFYMKLLFCQEVV